MESILIIGLFSFAVTLIVNKSSLFECKREFVEIRYNMSKAQGNDSFLHWFWYKMNTCPMCLGMWSSLFGGLFMNSDYIFTVTGAFSVNWLLHCVEKYLFEASKLLEGQNKEKSEK